ncbi:MAG: hypothetical protein IPL95_19955 [Saprospiraceae bacterium]|nr:hypothetical protein [Saprospiraceae bacterium]
MGNEGNGQRINELRNRLPGINQFIIDMRIRGFVPFNQENLNYFIEIANTSSHENSFESDQEINESQSRELIANQEDMMSRLNFRGRDSIDNGSHRRIVHNSLNESDLTNNDNNPLSEAETLHLHQWILYLMIYQLIRMGKRH